MELLAIMFLFILSKLKIDSLELDLLVIGVYIHIITNKLSSYLFFLNLGLFVTSILMA